MSYDAAENPFPVVGVGASAGGLEALTRLMGQLPAKPGLAFIIIQHLDPHYQSQLTEILRHQTRLKVLDAEHGTKVRPNHVYVIQPNTDVALADGVLSVTNRPQDRRPHYPVDHFLRSLAAVQGPRAVGVVLSGTGSDGTLGLCEVKAAGGVTFAQDEASAQHGGMPHSAIASGAVDLVLPPEEIAQRLIELPAHPYLDQPDGAAGADPASDDFQRIIAALRTTSGVDFSQYRDATIKRRTARRMLLRGYSRPAEYAAFLERDKAEADALYRDILINVTSFFREPEMFEELKRSVFPEIVGRKSDSESIRLWVPGCSTGQEAYSLAIVLLEFLGTTSVKPEIQIFATDLGDPAALEQGRHGAYPENIELEVSPERLRRYFVKEDGAYRIQKSVRDLCVFARQNMTVDPPFSRVDLVSCRNVLIYMSPPLQERLLPVFHFALNQAGFLVLGASETVGTFGDLFEPVSAVHKIYRRKDSGLRPPLTFMADEWLRASPKRTVHTGPAGNVHREADRVLLGRYAPPAVLVNARFEVQQFHGRLAPFLEVPEGMPTMNVLRMARDGLFTILRDALTAAQDTRAAVAREHLRLSDGGRDIEFTLRILPVPGPHPEAGSLLVVFEGEGLPVWSPPPDPLAGAAPAERDMAGLRAELASSRQYLQDTLDAQEMSTQELRAAHEEVLSSNEELQSTNEELQTTKEELQSVNEELLTVNEQYQTRNDELDILADDLENFISSADVPMVTVGRDRCIRRLTPAAQRAFNVLPTDVGRVIDHIKFSLGLEDVSGIIERVIASGQPWEQELRDARGTWWVLRIRPYLTADNRVDGATLVAVDVDSVKRNRELAESRDYALAVVQTVREPLVVLDAEGRVGLANEAFYKLFDETPRDAEGQLFWEVGNGVWSEPSFRRTIVTACQGQGTIANLEIQRVVSGRGLRTLVLNARVIAREDRPGLLLLAIDDVTDARQAERLRIDAETLRLMDRRKDEFLGILAHELRNPLAPMRFALELMRSSTAGSRETTRAREVLERQVLHLVRIVDDLLDVSRITQGKVELRKESLRLADLVHAAVELSHPAIDAARHTLTVSLPDETVVLNGDSVRLTQVLVNLLNNAIKFTPPPGHIWLIAETVGEHHDAPNQVRVRVRDTGIGIAPDMLSRVFDMFAQGDRTLERTRGGLGVGLTLVKNLVALHGGEVEARSEGDGRGSEFVITLPIEPPAGPSESSSAPATRSLSARTLRILVADDNEDGREMLNYLLTNEGHRVTTAGDGSRALEIATSSAFDVAILDIGMPGLNGYELARKLRGEGSGPRPLLVALSGLGQAEDKARATEAGFDAHFTKPVDIRALMAFLSRRAI